MALPRRSRDANPRWRPRFQAYYARASQVESDRFRPDDRSFAYHGADTPRVSPLETRATTSRDHPRTFEPRSCARPRRPSTRPRSDEQEEEVYVHTSPLQASVSADSFTALGVSEPIAQALRMRGIDAPFEIQARVIPDALAGRDVLARSRTGSGKTLAFAAPLVERITPSGRSPSALILAPTRELASQVTEEFRAIADVAKVQVAAVYGGVGIGPQAKRARHADILIATPGRLIDLVERKLLRLDRVRICVLD